MNLDVDPMPNSVPVAEVASLAAQLLRQARLLNKNGDTIDRLTAEAWRVKDVLRDLLSLIEDGSLVRDISRDSEAGWHLRMLDFVRKIKAAQDALGEGI